MPHTPIEHITIEAPEWCHRCDAILPDEVVRAHESGWRPLCRSCAAVLHPHICDRREAARGRQRELVNVARQLAWHARHLIPDLIDAGWPHTAIVLQQLATETDRAIERLRRI
jgi:hypothetical protein